MSTDRRNGLTNEEEKSAVLWVFTGNRERQANKKKKSLILSVHLICLGGGERSEDKRPSRGTKQVGAPRPPWTILKDSATELFDILYILCHTKLYLEIENKYGVGF